MRRDNATDNGGSLAVYCASENARAKYGERAKGQRSPGGSEPQTAQGVGISKGKEGHTGAGQALWALQSMWGWGPHTAVPLRPSGGLALSAVLGHCVFGCSISDTGLET